MFTTKKDIKNELEVIKSDLFFLNRDVKYLGDVISLLLKHLKLDIATENMRIVEAEGGNKLLAEIGDDYQE